MKLIPTLETTDLDAGLMGCNGRRPFETEADWIAAAALPGEVTIREMAQVRDDRCVVHSCGMCFTDTKLYFETRRADWKVNLTVSGVTWDPSIRL